jgi:hypothetical protein
MRSSVRREDADVKDDNDQVLHLKRLSGWNFMCKLGSYFQKEFGISAPRAGSVALNGVSKERICVG